jgi:hypothetical protein
MLLETGVRWRSGQADLDHVDLGQEVVSFRSKMEVQRVPLGAAAPALDRYLQKKAGNEPRQG